MGFLNKKEEEPQMEVIEDKIEQAEAQLDHLESEVKQEKEIIVKEKEEVAIKKFVVKELPMQPIKFTTLEDGTKVEFITVEEALSEIMNS